MSTKNSLKEIRIKRIVNFLLKNGEIDFDFEYFDEVQRVQIIKSRKKRIKSYVDGFDLDHEISPIIIAPQSTVYQYLRNPSQKTLNPGTGNWFFMDHDTSMHKLAIFGGLSGRSLRRYMVRFPVLALKGVAKEMKKDWKYAIGGESGNGGGAQYYIPRKSLFSLKVI